MFGLGRDGLAGVSKGLSALHRGRADIVGNTEHTLGRLLEARNLLEATKPHGVTTLTPVGSPGGEMASSKPPAAATTGPTPSSSNRVSLLPVSPAKASIRHAKVATITITINPSARRNHPACCTRQPTNAMLPTPTSATASVRSDWRAPASNSTANGRSRAPTENEPGAYQPNHADAATRPAPIAGSGESQEAPRAPHFSLTSGPEFT